MHAHRHAVEDPHFVTFVIHHTSVVDSSITSVKMWFFYLLHVLVYLLVFKNGKDLRKPPFTMSCPSLIPSLSVACWIQANESSICRSSQHIANCQQAIRHTPSIPLLLLLSPRYISRLSALLSLTALILVEELTLLLRHNFLLKDRFATFVQESWVSNYRVALSHFA